MKDQEGLSSEKLNSDVQIPESAAQNECANRPVTPDITCGYVVIKTPVILAEIEVQVVTDSIIKFPEPVLEIKTVRKQLKIAQSRLLLPSDTIFLRGFVRKNIQYETPIGANTKIISSSLRSLTVDIPFSCVTEIKKYLSKPIYDYNENTEIEDYKQTTIYEFDRCIDHILHPSDMSQFDEISNEVFNEKVYCELIKGRIIDHNDPLNREIGKVCGGYQEHQYENTLFEEGTFTALEGKMVIDLKLKVLQQQQVRVESKKF
ncbi:hypothetical protein BK709_30400 [Bacillus thuringiensis serovar shandongiensis]|uniref:CsxC family protein n=1 Tax=Bacillus toyonensis TaxID=155322 RepID=UPI000B437AF0|nr:DUF3794 domain-containing protein [Bacillus toyonensis]MEC2394893.1 DUF3794 domain-containing protein [Bacillus toyonensis]OTX38305.1 hypothetical protein BK717_09360 [Bacillus thuringiensis serovar malayensis]OUB01372.1 hypothetical protein BK709_30400 [Bacillus thuringiensis serovar shandongiensis]